MSISSQEWELWVLFPHPVLRNGSDLYNALKGLLCNFPKSWGKFTIMLSGELQSERQPRSGATLTPQKEAVASKE